MPRRPLVFYGWWIAIGAMVMAALNGAVYAFGLSAFFLPLAEAFDVSRTRLSSVFGLSSLVSAVILPPTVGFLCERFSPRRTMVAGVSLLGLGFLLLSIAPTFLVAAIAVMVLAAGIGMGTTAPAFATLINWFTRRRGAAFGVANLGFGLGGILVMGTNLAVESLGYRWAAFALALGVWAVGFPVAALMRYRPEAYGYRQDGDTGPTAAEGADASPSRPREPSLTPARAMRTRVFWLISLALACQTMAWSATAIHFIPAVTEKGFSSTLAAGMFGVYGAISLPGRILAGLLGDKLPKRRLYIGTYLIMAIGMLTFAWANSVWQIVLFIALFANGAATWGALSYPMLSEYYGRKSIASIIGLGQMVQGMGAVIGPVVAGYVRDAAGMYEAVFLTLAVLMVVASGLMFLAGPPRPLARENPS